VTDGSLDYIRASLRQEDGCIGFVNHEYNELMTISITIDLGQSYHITKIRYNMGDVERAETWGADRMVTPFGAVTINRGVSYVSSVTGRGAWTEVTGNEILSEVIIILEKTRTSYETDWLFIGEIEVIGVPSE